MPDHKTIYQYEADLYENLVSREDYQQLILKTLQAIFPFKGSDVVELGAGTGRLTCQVAPIVKSIVALDQSQAMLDVAAAKLSQAGLHNWKVKAADHRKIPLANACSDLILSGWSLCYLTTWNPDHWQIELDKAFSEIHRLLRPGGCIILLETLGTGSRSPEAPIHLVPYYQYLESMGFQKTWIRSDYLFDTRQEAEELSRFFFGEEMVAKIEEDQLGCILPECTGIWQMQMS